MSYQMSVTFMGDYVEARSTGDKSYQTAVMLWQEIISVCGEHDCYKVLGIGESTTPMPTMDAMKHTKLFQDFSITRKYQIAWVELNVKLSAASSFWRRFSLIAVFSMANYFMTSPRQNVGCLHSNFLPFRKRNVFIAI